MLSDSMQSIWMRFGCDDANYKICHFYLFSMRCNEFLIHLKSKIDTQWLAWDGIFAHTYMKNEFKRSVISKRHIKQLCEQKQTQACLYGHFNAYKGDIHTAIAQERQQQATRRRDVFSMEHKQCAESYGTVIKCDSKIQCQMRSYRLEYAYRKINKSVS